MRPDRPRRARPRPTLEARPGERAVVTGAAGGLGQALCARLAACGYDVVAADLAGTDHPLDVTDPDACRALAAAVQPAVWVNNAGVLGAGAAAEQPDAEVLRVVQVNLLGVIHGTRAAVGVMRPTGRGRILNIGSLASWVAVPGEAVYAATKHGVRAFTVGLAAELRGSGVALSVLCPDGIWTPMLHDRLADPSAAMSFTGTRLLTADEVGDAAIDLLARGAILASVPRGRGLQTRLLGMAPGLSLRLHPMLDKAGRRRQAKLLAEGEPPR